MNLKLHLSSFLWNSTKLWDLKRTTPLVIEVNLFQESTNAQPCWDRLVSLLERAAAEPCIHHRRWQRRQRKPSAGCMRLPVGRAGWPGHTGSGRLCGNGIYGTGSCLSPSPRPAGRWSLWYLQRRKVKLINVKTVTWRWVLEVRAQGWNIRQEKRRLIVYF